MSDREAQAEAQKRFGVDGVAFHHTCSKPADWDWCRVDLRVGNDTQDWKVLGRGQTWEAAFADAAMRKRR